jgi:hypothetical protein
VDMATINSLGVADRALVMDTQRSALATLDEDQLLALHARVKRARDKYVKIYRRQAAAAVVDKGARGKASVGGRRDAAKAEVFEDALARVSRAVAKAASASAAQLKADRIAAARGERASAAAAAGTSKGRRPQGAGSSPATAPRAKSKAPIDKKRAAATLSANAQRQAKRDSRPR